MLVFWFVIISYILLSASLYLLFQKAGEEGWKGLVPGLNFVVWSKLVGRKPAYAAWMLFPIVNFFIYAGLCVDMVRSFGKYTFWDSALAVIYAPLKFFLIWKDPKDKYLGPTLVAEKKYADEMQEAMDKGETRNYKKLEANNPYKKGPMREWAEAIFFAVFAAAFIRMFLIEAYTIPTSSMEGSLLVGDFLFVSKAHYGIRTPKTVAMIPLLHNRIPILNRESYFAEPSIPFTRLPAIETIDRNDPVVFNYPEGDSVYVFPERTFSIYDYRRMQISEGAYRAIKTGNKELVVRPIDKMDHYIKRCVAIAGDTLEVRHRQLYINGEAVENPKNIQFSYLVLFPEQPNTAKFSDWGISDEDIYAFGNRPNGMGPNHMMLVLNQEQIDNLKAMDEKITIIPNENYVVKNAKPKFEQLKSAGVDERFIRGGNQDDYIMTLDQELVKKLLALDSSLIIQPVDDSQGLFPYDQDHFSGQNIDNYGPVWIPKKGVTVELKPENIAMFRRVISVYEDNDFKEENGKYFINGEETTSYTFKQDYFWMMGDNRHNSQDSRVWGYVPHTHVVGKPLFIWFSTKEGNMRNGINWNRIFTSASKF
ncbi:MAG: signal peptidase I [Saprospiraceae bacterium]